MLNEYRKIRELTQADAGGGHFDPVRMVHHVTVEWNLLGESRVISYKERLYILPELVRLCGTRDFVWTRFGEALRATGATQTQPR